MSSFLSKVNSMKRMLYAENSPASKGTLPCLTMDGKIILEAKDKVRKAREG